MNSGVHPLRSSREPTTAGSITSEQSRSDRDQGQIKFMVGLSRPYTLLMRNVATREDLLSTIASLKHSRRLFASGDDDIDDINTTKRIIELELLSGDWDIVDENLCIVTLDDWRHVVSPGGFYCLLRSGDEEMEDSATTWSKKISQSRIQAPGSNNDAFSTGQPRPNNNTSTGRATTSHPSTIPSIPGLDHEYRVVDSDIGSRSRFSPPSWRRPPSSAKFSDTASTSGTSASSTSFVFDSISEAFNNNTGSPAPADVIIITAFQGLQLPCAYPPPPEKTRKCSFASSTVLWKVMRAISGGSKTNFQLFWLRVREDSKVGKRLEIGKRVTASRDTTLFEMGLRTDGGGPEGYLLLICA